MRPVGVCVRGKAATCRRSPNPALPCCGVQHLDAAFHARVISTDLCDVLATPSVFCPLRA